MELIIFISVAVVAALALIVIFWRQRATERQYMPKEPGEPEFSYPDVEYQWSARPPVMIKLLVFAAMLIGFLVYWYYGGDEGEFSDIFQLFIPLAGLVFAFLAGIWRGYTFQITTGGLDVIAPGSKKERKMLFSWSDLLWFKPANDGFYYYLRPEAHYSSTTAGKSVYRSNKIPCGKHTTLVNAIIMARGVPNSPPSG